MRTSFGEPGFHAVCEVATKTVEDEQSLPLQQAAQSVCPHCFDSIQNMFIAHPSFLMTTNNNSIEKLLPGQRLPFEDYMRCQLSAIGSDAEHHCAPLTFGARCTPRDTFCAFEIHGAIFWRIEPDRCLVCVPYLRKVIAVLPSKAVHETVEL